MSWYVFFFQCPLLPEFVFSAGDFAVLKKVLSTGCTRPDALTPDDVEAYVYAAQKGGLTAPINYYRALEVKTAKQLEEEYPEPIETPTLIVWGTADEALERSQASEAAKLHRNCVLKWVEGASHWVQQDQPGLVNEHMRRFLLGGELRHK